MYDPAYVRIAYPLGDVPRDRGVCTDVIVRAYRKMGIDLQELVHKDMKNNFHLYPKTWGMQKPDPNIDHRRVPNLQKFFSRKGKTLPITKQPEDYQPGHIVTWILPRNLPHIGIVSQEKTPDGSRYLIVHNVGSGQVIEDFLFQYPITGHYQYPSPL